MLGRCSKTVGRGIRMDTHAQLERDEAEEEFGLGFACVGVLEPFWPGRRDRGWSGCSSQPPRQDDDLMVAVKFSRCGASLGVRGAWVLGDAGLVGGFCFS